MRHATGGGSCQCSAFRVYCGTVIMVLASGHAAASPGIARETSVPPGARAFAIDPCDGTYILGTAGTGGAGSHLSLVDPVWSPRGDQIAGTYQPSDYTGWSRPVVVDVATGAQRNVGGGAQEVLGWTKAGMLIRGPNPRRPRVGPVGWWLLRPGGKAPVNLGRGLIRQDWNVWTSPISPKGAFVIGNVGSQLAIVSVHDPRKRVTVPSSAGTVLVGWTNRDQPIGAAGDSDVWPRPKGRMRLIDPRTGQLIRTVGPGLTETWAIAWSGDRRHAFILEDEEYKYVGRARRTLANPVGWLLSSDPAIGAKRLPAWQDWGAMHPDTEGWPRLLSMGPRGRQVAVVVKLRHPSVVGVGDGTTTWSSLVGLVDTNGRSRLRTLASLYVTNLNGDSDEGSNACVARMHLAPAGARGALFPQVVG